MDSYRTSRPRWRGLVWTFIEHLPRFVPFWYGLVSHICAGFQGSLWAVGASHSTATLSSGGTRGLYGLRLMHRLNIFLSRSGLRAGRAIFFGRRLALTLTLVYLYLHSLLISAGFCISSLLRLV